MSDHISSMSFCINQTVLQGDLRIAHCGGFHSNLDRLITAFNVLAKLLHHNIRWDSETIGCEPSLSSIPAAEQRTLLMAMQEIADWLAQPQNLHEFLIIFFDDQMDLEAWVSILQTTTTTMSSHKRPTCNLDLGHIAAETCINSPQDL